MRALCFFLALGTGVSLARAHPSTLHRHESSLDPRESVRIARVQNLRVDAPARTGAETHCRLSIRLIDAETKKPLPGLIRIAPPKGAALELPGLMSRGLKLRTGSPAKAWHVVTDPTVIMLPREQLVIDAFSGLETEMTTVAIDLRGNAAAEVVVPLRRIFDAKAAGWRSGNTHLHLRGMSLGQANDYLQTIPVGDGVELVFVSHLTRAGADADYISNEYTQESLDRLSSDRLLFGNGEEHRNNIGRGGEGFGHVLFLDLPQLVHPISIGPGISGAGPDYPPLSRGIDRARAQGSTIVWCHNGFGFEHVPAWLSGRVHALNIFDGGTTGSYVQTFYRFLDVGLRVPFSTGTDWFMYDFSRVYVQLREPLTLASWRRGLEAGRTIITNGPLLEFQAAERSVGETVALATPGKVPLRARATGRIDFKGLELVHDGRVVARAPSRRVGAHYEADVKFPLAVEKSGWVAARIPGGAIDGDGFAALPPNMAYRAQGSDQNELGETIFAHTSAIYLDVAGRPRFDPKAAEELIAAMEKSMATLEASGKFDDGAQRQEVLAVYRDGIERLRRQRQ